MRIAFIVNEFPAISETFVLDQLTGLIGQGCEVDVFAHQLIRNAESHPDVSELSLMDRAHSLAQPAASRRIVRVAQGLFDVTSALLKSPGAVGGSLGRAWTRQAPFRLDSLYQMLAFVSQKPYDVVHCHFGPNGIRAAELKDIGAIKCPVITQFHGYDASSYVQDKGEAVYRNLFQQGDLFLCVSECIRSRVVAWGCEARKARVHHTGVKVKRIPFVPRAYSADQAPRLLSVSRLVEKKGLEYGVQAAAQLVRDHPHLEYTIVGDGPERMALTGLSHDLGIDRNVRFVGARTRDEVATMMAQAHILLTPSVRAHSGDEEGIPVVLMEALASGLPVVSTTHAGIPELIVSGVSGLLAPERDPTALAQHVQWLLTHPLERLMMTDEGRRAVERDFDSDLLNQELIKCYRELIERAKT